MTKAIQGVDLRGLVTTRYNGDVLTGLQFADSGSADKRAMVEVSAVVNTPAWHAQVLAMQAYYESGTFTWPADVETIV